MPIRRFAYTLSAGLVVLLAVVAAGSQPAPASAHDDNDLTVMTQNLYIGTDLAPVFGATSLPALFAAVQTGWANVQATNFPERANTIAAKVDKYDPDIISVQEATLLRTGPAFNPAPSTVVAYDYLQILVDALAARGLHYEVAAVVTGSDVELPTLTLGLDIRVTDRDALLVRSGPHGRRVDVVASASANYVARVAIPTVAGPLALPRGWASLDVRTHGRVVRVIGTHLEVDTSPVVQAAQAAELLAGPANTSMPVILAGDFNSAAAGTIRLTPSYGMLRAAGFADSWSKAHPGRDGFTCCQAPDLLNALPTFDARIDLVMFRGRFDVGEVRRIKARTLSGLWQSDHAGLVASLELRGN